MRNDEIKGILQGIYDRQRSLTPEMVVDEARALGHPLHSHFEWDDEVAAEGYRREQARGLIRSVKIVYSTDKEGRDKTTRAFVSTRREGDPTRTYEPTEEVVLDPVRYQMLLSDFRRDWQRFQARWMHLQEFRETVTHEVSEEQQTG